MNRMSKAIDRQALFWRQETGQHTSGRGGKVAEGTYSRNHKGET